jgi:pimeloyl-ACP methyl ester carboxylesterase
MMQNSKANNTQNPKWSGLIPVDDTQLYTNDTGGSGIPIVYLNGQFANMSYWKKVILQLGSDFRHITFDERARGTKSGTSADYSFETCVSDVDVILSARNIDKCIVVGWSYGAFVAAYWASRNPERCIGAVFVDGAQPYTWITEEMATGMRKFFKILNPIVWLLRPTGITPRLSASKMAEINIELGWVGTKEKLGPVMDTITAPSRYVLASGASFGSKGDEQEVIRTGAYEAAKRNSNIKVSAKVSSNHGNILKKDFKAVANAVVEIVSLNLKN